MELATINASLEERGEDKNDLQDLVEIAVGMPIIITRNIDFQSHLVNGARGTVVDYLLNPNEPEVNVEDGTIMLHSPPAILLVRMDDTSARPFGAYERGIVPVEPVKKSYRINFPTGQNAGTHTVHRLQLPITPAYAFTDYRAQGQIIKNLIVDIAKPPMGRMSLFNLYVALSRSHGRQTIRILRPFEDEQFKTAQLPELEDESSRLLQLTEFTRSNKPK